MLNRDPKPIEAGEATASTPRFDLIVVAGSADGIGALSTILQTLPPDWSVPIAIVQHRTGGNLPAVLRRRTSLPVKLVEPGEALQLGNVYVAWPDLHLVLRPDRTLTCLDGTRIRFQRSSAIPLLESASEVLGHRVIAVILSGTGTDATDGVQAVRARGGIVIAQDPATIRFPGMPNAAIASGSVDYVLPIEQIGPALRQLTADGRLPTQDG